jgi:HNH endonuclease
MDEVLFDPEDAHLFKRAYVCNNKKNYKWVRITLKSGRYSAARFLMNPPEGMVVDHINGNGLDNRKSNLRIVPQKQNCANRVNRHKRNTTGYRNVYLEKRDTPTPWRVAVAGTYLGLYQDKMFAAAMASTWRTLYMPGATC